MDENFRIATLPLADDARIGIRVPFDLINHAIIIDDHVQADIVTAERIVRRRSSSRSSDFSLEIGALAVIHDGVVVQFVKHMENVIQSRQVCS